MTNANNFEFHDFHPTLEDFHAAVIAGLTAQPKQLSPKFFYDATGSQWFDAITALPEYYPTRTEIALLRDFGEEIAQLLGHNNLLVELGSGSSLKIRTLLDVLQPAVYMPIDISREHLQQAALSIAADYAQLHVCAVCADYSQAIELPELNEDYPRVAFFPGSSIGNFEPKEARLFLQRVAAMLGNGGKLLIGVDLRKDPALLHAAYNDNQGVTAAFNLNLLERINRELGADFQADTFRHYAFYNPLLQRIEMHLLSMKNQAVRCNGALINFENGENIHTENSYKYSLEAFAQLATEAGFATLQVWQDKQALFSLHCLQVLRF
jgi:dimethylhistidine N-methyltransferase